jgi:hypothetical protein
MLAPTSLSNSPSLGSPGDVVGELFLSALIQMCLCVYWYVSKHRNRYFPWGHNLVSCGIGSAITSVAQEAVFPGDFPHLSDSHLIMNYTMHVSWHAGVTCCAYYSAVVVSVCECFQSTSISVHSDHFYRLKICRANRTIWRVPLTGVMRSVIVLSCYGKQ